MKKDPYIVFVSAKWVAFAWIGSVVGPIFILIGLVESSNSHLYFGLAFTLIVILSIWDGIKALKIKAYTDFIAYALVPIITPILVIVYTIWSSSE